MALVPAKCTQCGGQIEVDDTKEAGICKHCGMPFITEKAINNYTTVHNVTNNITKIINGKEMDDGETHFNRGVTNLKLKKYDAARRNFDKAIRENPEISKYYFYWCLAESKNFNDLNIFLGYNNNTYTLAKDNEETYSIDSFFILTTMEECEQLSKEYGIDLTNGFEGVVLWCITQFYKRVPVEYKFEVVWMNALEKLKKGTEGYKKLVAYGIYYLIKIVASVYDKVIEDNSCRYIGHKKDLICSMINYMIANGLCPIHSSLKGKIQCIEIIEFAMKLVYWYLEDTISGLNSGKLKVGDIDDVNKEILLSFKDGKRIYMRAVNKEKRKNKKSFLTRLFKK